MTIAILEDDPRRREAMESGIAANLGVHERLFFDSAPAMIEWLRGHLARVKLISLDHDLVELPEQGGASRDPGTGQDVADFLAGHPPCCPVLIHTSNRGTAPGMAFALQSAGWEAERVPPFDDLDWIAKTWVPRLVLKMRSRTGV